MLLSIEVAPGNDKLLVNWIRVPRGALRDPFVNETTGRILKQAQDNVVLTTDIHSLLNRALGQGGLYPSGFIFHVSRCGSTILSNMLNVAPRHFVLAEPHIPVHLLNKQLAVYPESFQIDLIRSIISSFSEMAPATAARYFVKFFSGCLLHVPLIREAIPNVKEIFLYRDPIEVVVSTLKDDTCPWWLWSEEFTGLPRAAAMERPVTELAARAIGMKLKTMLHHVRDMTLLMNYSEIGSSTANVLLDYFELPKSDEILAKMNCELTIYSKDVRRQRVFQSDSANKQAWATVAMRDAVERFARVPYETLEQLRMRRALE